MKYLVKILLFFTILCSVQVSAQDKKERNAEEEFKNLAYYNAITSYEKLIDEGYSDEQIFKNLGNANYLTAKYDEAVSWYGKLFRLEDAAIDANYIYRYAQSLKSNGEYNAADIWMKKLEEIDATDSRGKKFNERQEYLDEIKTISDRFTITNLTINSSESDFAPSFHGDNLVFATERDTGVVLPKINQWTNKPFLNLYTAKLDMRGKFKLPHKFSATMNQQTDESTTAFTKDGQTLYFTRNNSQKGKFARDKDGISRLKIYRAILVDGEWSDITELPFNSDGHSAANPALSPDESKLYFASDMDGTNGQSDIFVVDITGDGLFGEPKNLGPEINTESRETFPYVAANNVLYFASDGHPGLGGLDIFAVDLDDMENIQVTNVGSPINSLEDDFSFIIDDSNKKGYFSSNRDGGRGSDDIYAFNETKTVNFKCHTVVDGIIKDRENGNALAGALIVVFDNGSNIVAETFTEKDGSFSLYGPCEGEDYNLIASKDGYNKMEQSIQNVGDVNTKDIRLSLGKTFDKPVAGINLISFLGLDPIYFDSNMADIRPDSFKTIGKVIAFMKRFPDLKVQIQAHTDAKAGANYNVVLSQKRADNTVLYLISNGVESSRLSSKGFGKSNLINDCSTGEACTDERHQENRRSEFIIVE